MGFYSEVDYFDFGFFVFFLFVFEVVVGFFVGQFLGFFEFGVFFENRFVVFNYEFYEFFFKVFYVFEVWKVVYGFEGVFNVLFLIVEVNGWKSFVLDYDFYFVNVMVDVGELFQFVYYDDVWMVSVLDCFQC